MTQLIGTGRVIFRAGAEPRNSQKHAKYRKIVVERVKDDPVRKMLKMLV